MSSRAASPQWKETQRLLRQRRQRKWDSFSWLALRPLISSVNDRINRYAPTLVPDLRHEWVRRQGGPDLPVVDASECSAFIVLGDPGEQDASQYVVVPSLRQHAADVDFMVICSDVIYPSGDVNDYVDGFYVPYRELPGLPILALPGNHDWYDGLTGFMWHFCGAEPLPPTAIDPRRTTPLRERPFRFLWRRPSHPDPRLELDTWRAGRAPLGEWTPLQPGPYYAIETEHVLLVCIDTGIDRRIDREQGEWLRRVSALPKPKVLLTGAPLVVDRRRDPCEIVGGPVSDGRVGGTHFFHSVADIVEHAPHGYVASIGGDIHNFQHYRVGAIEHIVSGGGGAYMTATHPIPVAVKDPCTPQPEVPEALRMCPTAPESLRHFARLLLPKVWRLVRVLLAVLAGLVTAIVALQLADHDPWPQRALRVGWWALLASVALRLLVIPPRWTRTSAYRLGVVIAGFLAGAAIVSATWWLSPEHYLRLILTWVGLTGCGGAIAFLLRITGWWRPPLPKAQFAGQRDQSVLLWFLVAEAVLFAIALLLVHQEWLLTLAAVVTAVATIGGWTLRWTGRPRRPRCSWKKWGPRIAYGVQVFDAVVVLCRVDGLRAGAIMLGIAAGLAALAVVAVGSVLVLSLPMSNGVRAGLIFVLLVFSQCVIWACRGGASSFQRAVLIAALFAIGIPGTAFGTDALRRRLGSTYKIVAALAAADLGLLLFGFGALDTWLPRATCAAALMLAMSLITVVTLHLMFLGAFSLIWDVGAHRTREQLDLAQADKVIRWRAGSTRPPWRHVRRRANIVFPGSDHPHGPIQSAVSEIFDSDEPPFFKTFLVVTSDAEVLTVTAHVVTGTTDVPAPYRMSIPLRRGS